MEDFQLVNWITGSASHVATCFALLVGACWALRNRKLFRELKHSIEFDLDAEIVKLQTPVETNQRRSRNNQGILDNPQNETLTHLVDVALIFGNKGKTRFRLYNAQLHIYTMGDLDKISFSKADGRFSLMRIFSSGNIVQEMKQEGKGDEDTLYKNNTEKDVAGNILHKKMLKKKTAVQNSSFYYIEPGVTQAVHFLTLIPEPREVIRIRAEFSFERKRIFPEQTYLTGRLRPHQAVKVFRLPEASGAQ